LLGCVLACFAVELKPETIEEFNRYIAAAEARLEPSFRGEHFLWFDRSPELRQRLLSGAIITQPSLGNGIIAIKGGLIQDQIGAVFIPHATLKGVLAIVQDYDRHTEVYKPDMIEAKLQSRKGNDFLVHARVVKAKFFLSDVLDIDNEIHFAPLDAKRVYSRSASKRVAEVTNLGKRNEHELPVGDDRGLMWRIYGYWFFEEADGGVYVTCESITLTRDIPFVMAKLLSPIIHDLPAEALRTSLEQTRRAVVAALSANP
jgi:hypothetical protein